MKWEFVFKGGRVAYSFKKMSKIDNKDVPVYVKVGEQDHY